MTVEIENGGDLNQCAYCGAYLQVVDGTEPGDAGESFWERYECKNGHSGRYEWDATSGKVQETFTGACKA